MHRKSIKTGKPVESLDKEAQDRITAKIKESFKLDKKHSIFDLLRWYQ
jgi:hypothetical protein